MLVYNCTAHAQFSLSLVSRSVVIKRTRHASCRYQEGSSRQMSLSEVLVTRVVVF